MKNSKIIIIVITVLVIGAGAYFLYNSRSKENFSGSFAPLAGLSVGGIGPFPSDEVKCSSCL